MTKPARCHIRATRNIQGGMVIVLVLWFLVLLTILAASYSSLTRSEARLASFFTQQAGARAIAEAGIWIAVNDLLQPEPLRRWRPDGRAESLRFADGEASIRVQGESGKIDLNTADPALLRGLLLTNGVDQDTADEQVNAILDWRDQDDLVRNKGFEDAEYLANGYGYGAKDGPFNSIDELRLVAGMTDKLYRDLAPALTIHSRQPGIDPMIAVPAALLALPNFKAEDLEAFISARESAAPGLIDTLPVQVDQGLLSVSGANTFTLSSAGTLAGSTVQLDVVILLDNNEEMPFSVLSWQEAKPRAAEPQSPGAESE